jgi:DNA polymerase III subunit chi
MAEVLFYHLQNQPLERVLPVLLGKCLERGWRVVVQAETPERVRALDDALWTFADESFLPHGTVEDGAPETQPILLTTEDFNPNAAEVRVLVEGAAGPDLSAYARALVLFDGANDESLARERERWKELKAAGHQVTYWQQDDTGRWEKKA